MKLDCSAIFQSKNWLVDGLCSCEIRLEHFRYSPNTGSDLFFYEELSKLAWDFSVSVRAQRFCSQEIGWMWYQTWYHLVSCVYEHCHICGISSEFYNIHKCRFVTCSTMVKNRKLFEKALLPYDCQSIAYSMARNLFLDLLRKVHCSCFQAFRIICRSHQLGLTKLPTFLGQFVQYEFAICLRVAPSVSTRTEERVHAIPAKSMLQERKLRTTMNEGCPH